MAWIDVFHNNINAMRSAAAMANSNADIKESMERLSTGSRINSAADDASGLAISAATRTQIKQVEKAIQNAVDGISLVKTADGASQEVEALLQRVRELSVQLQNGTMSNFDRAAVHSEVVALKSEIDRIGSNTEFNGSQLFDGGARSIALGADSSSTLQVDVPKISIEALVDQDLSVSDNSNSDNRDPRTVGLAGGGSVVIWESTSGVKTVLGQIYDSTGNKQGSEFSVETTSVAYDPEVAALANGGFAVTWRGDEPNPNVEAQLFDSQGTKIGGEIRVNANAAGSQFSPKIIGTKDGGFIVSFIEYDVNGADENWLSAQKFDAAGVAVGSKKVISTPVAVSGSTIVRPNLVQLNDYAYAVAWDPGSLNILDASLDKVGSTFSFAAGDGTNLTPLVTPLSGGSFAVVTKGVWQTSEPQVQIFEHTGATLADLSYTRGSAITLNDTGFDSNGEAAGTMEAF